MTTTQPATTAPRAAVTAPRLPVPTPDRIGQGTAVEMSRAVAEVHAAMYGAQQFPRDEDRAIRSMENSCRQAFVADRAFFRLPRGGETVTGPTVHLARELARCWGHIQHGVTEMRRDDEHGQSEMQAFAWDVQTGTRVAHTFIQPHKRDKKDWKTKVTAPEPLTTMQEIYEVNANNAARRLRECIFAVLPDWFIERAKQLCNETLATGDGTPLADRIDRAVQGFQTLGVNAKQLESKLELPRLRWTGHEVAALGVIFRALQNGETTREQEFPQERVDAAAVTEQATKARAVQPEAAVVTEEPRHDPSLPTKDEMPYWRAQLKPFGVRSAERITEIIAALADGQALDATKQEEVAATLASLSKDDEPGKALDGYLAALAENRGTS